MEKNKCILIIDEAHNLPEVAINILNEKITLTSLNQTIREAIRYNSEIALEVSRILIRIIEKNEKEKILKKKYLINEIERNTKYKIEYIIEELIKKGIHIRRKLALKGKTPRSHIHHLGKFLKALRLSLNNQAYTIIARKDEIELNCFDPRVLTIKALRDFPSIISISGTIENESYSKIIGLEKSRFIEVSFKPKPDQILTIVTSNVTSDFEKRSIFMYRRMLEYIVVTSEIVRSGIGIFAASYEVLRGLVNAGITEIKRPIFIEDESYNSKTIERQLLLFKEKARRGGALYLGVCGGKVAEGEDFPEKEMDVVILAGIPFPEPTLALKAKIKYYKKIFGKKAKLYSYIIPSIWKASQAAGRTIRGPDDRGAIIYLDYRYLKYSKIIPSWLRPRKVINNPMELKEELCLFFT